MLDLSLNEFNWSIYYDDFVLSIKTKLHKRDKNYKRQLEIRGVNKEVSNISYNENEHEVMIMVMIWHSRQSTLCLIPFKICI